jgi:SAM-dependent methyltransferase
VEDYREINRKAYNMLAKEYRLRINRDKKKDNVLLKPFFDYLKGTFHSPIRVMDIGCGNGLNLKMFIKEGFISVGIDISESMTNLAHEISPKSIVIRQDFLDSTIESESFEGVLSKASIHLFKKDDALYALDKIHTSLVKKGMLFIATTVSDESKEGLYHKKDYQEKILRFRKFWTPAELEEAILEVGFKIKKKFTNYEKDWDKNWFNILAVK